MHEIKNNQLRCLIQQNKLKTELGLKPGACQRSQARSKCRSKLLYGTLFTNKFRAHSESGLWTARRGSIFFPIALEKWMTSALSFTLHDSSDNLRSSITWFIYPCKSQQRRQDGKKSVTNQDTTAGFASLRKSWSFWPTHHPSINQGCYQKGI